MKKRVEKVKKNFFNVRNIVIILVVLLLIVLAWYFFKGITGEVILGPSECVEFDGGVVYSNYLGANKVAYDFCHPTKIYTYKYSCSGNTLEKERVLCGEEGYCDNGKCVSVDFEIAGKCYDDGKKVFKIRDYKGAEGKTNFIYSIFEDFCTKDESKAYNIGCDENGREVAEVSECSEGCVDGACVGGGGGEVVDCSSISITDSGREEINIRNLGNDKMIITFKEHRGYTTTTTFAKSTDEKINLMHDNDGKNITVREKEEVRKNGYVVVGNGDGGYLLKVSTIINQSDGYSNDKVVLTDVFNPENSYTATLTSDGTGTITIGGKVYYIYYVANNPDIDLWSVYLDYPDSFSNNEMIIYPTIQTSLRAKVMFYEPLTISLSNWDGKGNSLSKILIPNGNGYSKVDAVGGDVQAGVLTYKFGIEGDNLLINLRSVEGNTINEAALVVFEEKDTNGEINALIVTLEEGSTAIDGIGVNEVQRTWSGDSEDYESLLPGTNNILKECDLWGTIVHTNLTDSDQMTALISYPDNQVF